jgi:hypothetical protein
LGVNGPLSSFQFLVSCGDVEGAGVVRNGDICSGTGLANYGVLSNCFGNFNSICIPQIQFWGRFTMSVMVLKRGLASAAMISMTAVSAMAQTVAAPVVTPVAAAGNAGQSAVSVSTVKPEDSRTLFGEIYVRADMDYEPLSNVTKKSAAPEMINFVGVKYKTDVGSFSLRQRFNYSPSVTDKAGVLKGGDTYINFAKSKVFTFGDTGYFNITAARVYLPTGESSVANGTQGLALAWLTLGKGFGKWDLSMSVIPTFSNQTKNSSINKKGEEKPLSETDLTASVDLGYNFTERLGMSYGLGINNSWNKVAGNAGVPTFGNSVDSTIEVAYDAKAFVIALDLVNSVDFMDQKRALQMFRSDELKFKLLFTATL